MRLLTKTSVAPAEVEVFLEDSVEADEDSEYPDEGEEDGGTHLCSSSLEGIASSENGLLVMQMVLLVPSSTVRVKSFLR